jgi:hypothetical protein
MPSMDAASRFLAGMDEEEQHIERLKFLDQQQKRIQREQDMSDLSMLEKQALDPQRQMQGDEAWKVTMTGALNEKYKALGMPPMPQLPDVVTPAAMKRIADLRTQTKLSPTARWAMFKGEFNVGNWATKNAVALKDAFTVQGLDMSGPNGQATGPAGAAKPAVTPGEPAAATPGQPAPTPETPAPPVFNLDTFGVQLFSDVYEPPLTPSGRIDKAATWRKNLYLDNQAGAKPEDTLRSRMMIWQLENPDEPAAKFPQSYLADYGRVNAKDRKAQSDLYFKFRADFLKVGEAGRQGIVNAALDAGLPDTYVRDLQTMPATPQKDVAAGADKDRNFYADRYDALGKRLGTLNAKHDASPDLVQSVASDMWHAKFMLDNPGSSPADAPPMPEYYSKGGALTQYQFDALKDKDEAMAFSKKKQDDLNSHFDRKMTQQNEHFAAIQGGKGGKPSSAGRDAFVSPSVKKSIARIKAEIATASKQLTSASQTFDKTAMADANNALSTLSRQYETALDEYAALFTGTPAKASVTEQPEGGSNIDVPAVNGKVKTQDGKTYTRDQCKKFAFDQFPPGGTLVKRATGPTAEVQSNNVLELAPAGGYDVAHWVVVNPDGKTVRDLESNKKTGLIGISYSRPISEIRGRIKTVYSMMAKGVKKPATRASAGKKPAGKAGISGLVTPGNIDLHNRPIIHNPDGSYSTVNSYTFTTDGGKAILVPGVNGTRKLTADEARDQYKKTGKHLGIFASEEAANTYAENLHKTQAKEYGKRAKASAGKKPAAKQSANSALKSVGL